MDAGRRYSESEVSSEELDQPPYHDKPKKVFILSTPRSGSYLLCRFMINAGLGMPHEYFNPIIMKDIASRLGLGEMPFSRRRSRLRQIAERVVYGRGGAPKDNEFIERYIRAVVERRCQGGVFAAKIHYDQYVRVLDNLPGHALLSDGCFIHLYREDLCGQAVSTHFSNLTGRWGINAAVTTPPVANPDFFDATAIAKAVAKLADDDRAWRVFMARNGITPLSVSYERLVKDPFAVVQGIAELIGADTGALRRGYSESGDKGYRGDGEPDKREVARRFVEQRRDLAPITDGGMLSGPEA